MIIVLKNGRIWDGENFKFGDLVVENGKIVEIGQCRCVSRDYEFDVSGAIISAGLVDIHVHLRNVSSDEFGVQGESCCFPFGVTAVADASCGIENQKLLDSFQLKNVVFACTDFKDNNADFRRTESILEHVDAVGIKAYFDIGISEVEDINPLKEVCSYARDKGLKVMVHCTNPPVTMSEVLSCLSKGDICTHTYHGVGHTVIEDDFYSLKQAKERGVVIDTGMAGGVHMDFSIMKKALEAGAAPDTISTDITKYSAFVRGGRYGMTLAMSIMRTLGMKEEDIMKAVTSAPAKVVNMSRSWGGLKLGEPADVAVLKYTDQNFNLTDRTGNSLEANKGYLCLLTMLDGQVVFRDDRI